MNCFPCFSSKKNKEDEDNQDVDVAAIDELKPTQQTVPENMETPTVAPADYENNSSIKAYNFRELASATKNFRQECLLGEGSLGNVYRGTIQATGREVAVKQLDRNAMEEGSEFFVEVGQLSLLQHPNLVSLVGYCADGDQRLLVYEFMSGGSLEHHLHGDGGKPLDWATRMKIAHGTAQGLQYLHEKSKPPVIYRNLKSSKVLLDEEFNPKLSNIGIDKLGSSADSKMPMQSKIVDNNGYNAPECVHSGTISAHTDVYSFGVVLLELISGRKAIDPSRPANEQNLVAWAQPIFKEPKSFPKMADPSLKKRFPERGLNQAVAMAAMCVQEEAAARPLIGDLAPVLSFLSIPTQENNIPAGDSGESNENETTDEESGSDDSSNVDRSLSRNGDRSLSHKSCGRSMSSNGSSNRREHSLSHRGSGSDASDGNSEDDEGDASSSNEKADELRNDSMKSVGKTDDSSVKKNRKKKSSEKIPKGQKSSSKKKKSKDANDLLRHKSRRKSKKRSDKDDDDSPRGSDPEN